MFVPKLQEKALNYLTCDGSPSKRYYLPKSKRYYLPKSSEAKPACIEADLSELNSHSHYDSMLKNTALAEE